MSDPKGSIPNLAGGSQQEEEKKGSPKPKKKLDIQVVKDVIDVANNLKKVAEKLPPGLPQDPKTFKK